MTTAVWLIPKRKLRHRFGKGQRALKGRLLWFPNDMPLHGRPFDKGKLYGVWDNVPPGEWVGFLLQDEDASTTHTMLEGGLKVDPGTRHEVRWRIPPPLDGRVLETTWERA